MAVQQITHKKITKFDTSNPNYKETPKPKVEVSGNVREDEDVYGERKHTSTCLDATGLNQPITNERGIISLGAGTAMSIIIASVDVRLEHIAYQRTDTSIVVRHYLSHRDHPSSATHIPPGHLT